MDLNNRITITVCGDGGCGAEPFFFIVWLVTRQHTDEVGQANLR